MYDYISLRVEANPCNETVTDLLAAFLADVDFETFEPDENGLTAFVRKDKYNPGEVKEIIEGFPIKVDFKISEQEIKGEDWNKEWEQNYFQPILIDDALVIRSSFHTDYPAAPIEIVIDPKMAFGTGHHSTTAGMSRMLLKEPLKGKTVIDMGTGTGILAILTKKLGATKATGIDIDKFAIENAIENGILNNEEIEWMVGDDAMLASLEPSDIFLANINLNVITSGLKAYVKKLKKGGKIFLSGFLNSDRDTIMEAAQKEGLRLQEETTDNNWMTMKFVK